MPAADIERRLNRFAEEHSARGKGWLSVMLVGVDHARNLGLPLDADTLKTEKEGQVKGLGKAAVQRILAKHGIARVLAEEAGRTSRGSMGNMKAFVGLLNAMKKDGIADLDLIEKWIIQRVKEFFAAKPFVLAFDQAKSVRAVVRGLLEQADKRQKENPGTQYAGAVLQHLIGAKLEVVLGEKVGRHGANVADQVSGRNADFHIGDVAIHCTLAPSEAVVRKCHENLQAGLRPIIVTNDETVARGLTRNAGLGDRIDVFDAEQFLAGNLYELGKFQMSGRKEKAGELIAVYNEIIEQCETDPSLKVQIQ